MKNKLQAFCRSYYSAHSIPLTFYQGEKICYSSFEDSVGIAQKVVPFGGISLRNPDFLVTQGDMFYGCIYIVETDFRIIAGPVCSVPVNNDVLHTFLVENAIPQDKYEDAAVFFRRVPLMNNAQFMKVLEFLHFAINQEQIEIAAHFYPNHQSRITTMAKTEAEQIYSYDENVTFHNTHYFEQELYRTIKQGDIVGLNELLQKAGTLQAGVLADTPLRQLKNQFIGTATKAGMLGAIPGGMDPEEVYDLIDLYIQKMERMKSVDSIQELQYSMIMDFCQRTAAIKIPDGISDEMHLCMTYIRNNVNNIITVADVAKQINRSETYIIRKFKKELRVTIVDYMTNCKIEVAKRLLAYSDKSLADISFYLCFSSQSYFQNVFKKKTGMTPSQYRKQKQ
ncbi:MAG: AraC family transcriptional regulator [Clostridium sp.]|nr:AraC family transcriptional regulator [Clostridium sp.]